MTLELTLLGTGTPTPSLRRACSGYLVRCGGDVILLDHGFGAYQRLLEAGVRPTEVTHAFLSHLHYDHMGDIARLVLTRWDQGAGHVGEMKIYGPRPLATVMERLIGRDGAFGPDLISRTENECSLDVYRARGGVGARKWPAPAVRELAPNEVVTEGAWSVRTVAVAHFGPHLRSYGFRLEAGGVSIVYSGDTGPCESMKRLAAGCDVLIHMCHYLSGTAPSKAFAASCTGHMELAELAAEAGVKTLVLTHITEQFDQPGLREQVIREIGTRFPGHVIFGADGMKIPASGVAAHKLM